MDPLDFIVSDLISSDNVDKLLSALFIYDDRVDIKEVIHLVDERFNSYKNTLSDENMNYIGKYLSDLSKLDRRQELLLARLRETILNEFDSKDFDIVNNGLFWCLFSVAIKKCLIMPKAKISKSVYFDTLKMITSGALSRKQEKAHNECIMSFNFDLDQIQDVKPFLKVFLPPMRCPKKMRTKKKHIKRVLKNAKKIILVHKLFHIQKVDHTFCDGVFLVPEQFTKVVIKSFLSD